MMDLRQDPDRVPGRVVALGAVIVVATIILSVVVVLVLTEAWRGRISTSAGGASVGRVPSEVNHLESGPFDRRTDGERDALAARSRLGGYGWVDRARGRVHVPIDVAMELLLAETPRGAR
jgi:hypothetical protein